MIAAYIQNRFLDKPVETAAYKTFTDLKTNLSKMRIFGTIEP